LDLLSSSLFIFIMEGSDMPLNDGDDYIVNNSDDLLQALSLSSVVPQALHNTAAPAPNMGANVLLRQNSAGSTMMHSSTVLGSNRGHNSSIISSSNTFNGGGGRGPGTAGWTSQEQKRQHDLEELHQRLERNQEQQRQAREAQKQEELGRLILQQQEQEKQQQQQMALGNHSMNNNSNHHNTLMNGSSSIHGALANSIIGGPFAMTTQQQQQAPQNAATQQEQQLFHFNQHPQQQLQQQHHVALAGSNHSSTDHWGFPMTKTGLPVTSSPILPNIVSRAPNINSNPLPTNGGFAKLQQDLWLRSQYPPKDNTAGSRTGAQPISSLTSTSSYGSTQPFHNNDDNGNSAAGGEQLAYMNNERTDDVSQGPLLDGDSLGQDMMNRIASNTLPPTFNKNSMSNNNPLSSFTSNNDYKNNGARQVTRNRPFPSSSHNTVDDYNNDNTSDFSNNKNNSDNDDNDDNDFDNLFNTGNVDNPSGDAHSIRPVATASQILSPPQHSNEDYDDDMINDSSDNNNNPLTDAMDNSSNLPLTSFDSFSSFVPGNNQSKNYDSVSVQLSNAIGRQIEAVAAGNPFMAPPPVATDVIDIFEEDENGDNSGVSDNAKRPRLTPPPPPSSIGGINLAHHNFGNKSNMPSVQPSAVATMSYFETGANAPLLMNKRKPGSGTPIEFLGRPTLPNTYNASRPPLDTASLLQQAYGNKPYLAPYPKQQQQQLRMGQLQQHPPEFLQLPEDFVARWDQLMPVPKPQRTFRSFSLSLLNVREFTITGLSVTYEGPPSSVAGLRADIKKMSRSCGEKAVFDRDVDGVEGGRWRIPLVRREQMGFFFTRMVEKGEYSEKEMLDKVPKHSDSEQHRADTPAPPVASSFCAISLVVFFSSFKPRRHITHFLHF
jgi:hypothetical protein